jgi:hypothetical protein
MDPNWYLGKTNQQHRSAPDLKPNLLHHRLITTSATGVRVVWTATATHTAVGGMDAHHGAPQDDNQLSTFSEGLLTVAHIHTHTVTHTHTPTNTFAHSTHKYELGGPTVSSRVMVS